MGTGFRKRSCSTKRLADCATLAPGPGCARRSVQKLRRRGAFDFPVLGVAAYVNEVSTGSGSDRVVEVRDAKIVLGGIAPSPIQVLEAGEALIGKELNDDQIQAAAEACYVRARPLDNTDFVMNWRKQMTREYTLRALEDVRTQRR